MELHSTLHELWDFFDSIIKNVNQITADLFSKGFQATIPACDVEDCEKAGIHLKNITATSSTMKINISEEYYDTKLKLLRKYEEDWNQLRSLLENKSKEELSMTILESDQRVFTEILSLLEQLNQECSNRNVFDGYKEEVVLAARILYTIDSIINEILTLFQPLQQSPMNSDNLMDFMPILQELSPKIDQIRNLNNLVNLISEISKKIWVINKEFALKFGEDPIYIQDPNQLTELLQDTPNILKRESMQRIISQESKNTKMDVYNILTNLIAKLIEIPLEDRQLLVPQSEIQL
jgi:hypothetical protein